jgi:hypothetical protein
MLHNFSLVPFLVHMEDSQTSLVNGFYEIHMAQSSSRDYWSSPHFWTPQVKPVQDAPPIKTKVEEPVVVRVIIWIVEILLYMIFQSPKSVCWASKTYLFFRQVWTPVVVEW